MELSAEQFEETLASLRSDDSASKNKRKKPRVGLRASIAVVETGPGGKGSRAQGMVRDLSRDGIGIQRSAPMKIGQRFLIQFRSRTGQAQSILCTVRHCEAVTSTTYHVGATFIRVCHITPKEDALIMNADMAEAMATQRHPRAPDQRGQRDRRFGAHTQGDSLLTTYPRGTPALTSRDVFHLARCGNKSRLCAGCKQP